MALALSSMFVTICNDLFQNLFLGLGRKIPSSGLLQNPDTRVENATGWPTHMFSRVFEPVSQLSFLSFSILSCRVLSSPVLSFLV